MYIDPDLSTLLCYARQLVAGMSQGRRHGCAAMLGDGRGFATNLHDVFLPWPMALDSGYENLSLGVAMQCSPTKEIIAQLPLAGLTKREENALRWIEGEGAMAWIIRDLPGLADDIARIIPDFSGTCISGLTPKDIMQCVALRANTGPYHEPPKIFGQLPFVESAISTWKSRRIKIAGRLPWSDEGVRIERIASNSSAIGGSEGDQADRSTAMETNEIIGDERGVRFGFSYPEWNMYENAYLAGYTVVQEIPLKWDPKSKERPVDARLYDFFREPLLKASIGRQEDGTELDLDALVDSVIAEQAGQEHLSNFYSDRIMSKRSAACAILIDRSMSLNQADLLTQELSIANALSEALIRAGERHAVFAFHSDGRNKVVVNILRDFADSKPLRVAASQIPPAGYTRIGAALRHVTARMGLQQVAQKLIIILSDGEPCDEGYEGHYAAADVAKAVEEAERDGINIAFLSVNPSGGTKLSERIGDRFVRLSQPTELAPALANLRSRLVL